MGLAPAGRLDGVGGRYPRAVSPAVSSLLREWAAVVRALGEGRIAVLVRTGGLHEPDGAGRLRMDRTEFGLMPTHLHQRPEHLAEGMEVEHLEEVPTEVDVEWVAGVRRVYRVEHEAVVPSLAALSGHRPEYARERFWFREPGLIAVLVAVHRLAVPRRVTLGPEHAGCRSWLTIDPPLQTRGARPVLTEAKLGELEQRLDQLIRTD